ncbi:MAG: glycosyltransferase family 4 protein [Chloroflexales bacterium]|nr:glycosyltransferase family 4 protein [Chloroflexales bacterium]
MHILINGSFWTQPKTGSGQYLHGLARWLPQVAPQHRYTLMIPATNDLRQTAPPGITVLPLRTPFDGRSENLAKLWFEQISVPQVARLIDKREARREARTIIHVPYAAPPLRCATPVITTVHDIIWKLLPEYAGSLQARLYYRLVSAAVRRVAWVITDSEHSRNDIIRGLGCAPDRVSTIYLAAGEQYQADDKAVAQSIVTARYGIAAPFVYYVGGLDARKNVATLIRAFALLQHDGSNATLVIAGRALGSNPRLFPDLDALIDRLQLGDMVRRIEVSYEDGPLLYQASTVFAYPSRYEGFGLTPLEAMVCGAPVVVSNASSLPEVVGEAALCVPPGDAAAWAHALSRLLADPAAREDLRQRGLKQAARFSWQRVAQETVQIYERCAASGQATAG